MRRLSVIVMTVMALAMASCVKDLEFDGEQSEPLLVVNGIQQVGQPARLCVEKSQFFLNDDKDFRVKDVAVDLYVNGAFKESLQVRDSMVTEVYIDWNYGNEVEVEELLYAFNYCEGQYLLCEGDQLRFEVHSSEFETATAEVSLPESPDVVSFDMVSFDTSNYTAKFVLKLKDPSGADYYNLHPGDALTGFSSSDPVFADLMGIDVESFVEGSTEYYANGPYNVINDTYFNGRTYSISMEKMLWGWEDYELFTLEVSRVDEHLYRYKTSYEAYESSDPGSILGMFTEPVQVYSNVENGVGVVCAQSKPVTFSIEITNQ